MESKFTSFGSSLKVQELAKEKLSTIPSRYVRPDHHHLTPSDLSVLPQIPVVDLDKLFYPNFADSELDKLHRVCKEWGFFQILKLMAKALGMKTEEMETLFGEGLQSMRMNYYPPCPQPELVTGLCPHFDAVGLTILLQVNEIEGLQIKTDDVWICVSPLPNAFVINIGDILEIVTNGTYRSIEHRATVNTKKERLSIATFLRANPEGDIGPAQSLVSSKTPPKFKKICAADYFRGLFSKELKGKSYIDIMRI